MTFSSEEKHHLENPPTPLRFNFSRPLIPDNYRDNSDRKIAPLPHPRQTAGRLKSTIGYETVPYMGTAVQNTAQDGYSWPIPVLC
jgi:hypothetical protein